MSLGTKSQQTGKQRVSKRKLTVTVTARGRALDSYIINLRYCGLRSHPSVAHWLT